MNIKSSSINHLLFSRQRNSSDLMSMLDEIRQDIQKLLNTRRPYLEKKDYSGTGILGYGISDLSQFRPESESDQERLIEEVTKLLKNYEPRLHSIRIQVENQEGDHRKYHLSLRIDAHILMASELHPVGFQSILELSKPSFKVEGMHYE